MERLYWGTSAIVILLSIAICNGATIKPYEHHHGSNNGHHPSVSHFARHVLCRDLHGKVKFFDALKVHLYEISDDLTINFVLDLCEKKDEMLDKWVKEIFDVDGDGYIAHFEREYHVYDD